MAIYHCSIQVASRSAGKSAVAMAAYRSGDRLIDERTGEQKYYARDVVPETAIMAPDHSPAWVYDRERLWNEVEKIEKQKNAQLCREMNVALPVELSHEQQQLLLANYCKQMFVDQGMVADVAIHRDDINNPHAHIMLTMRPFNPDGTWGAKSKKEYIMDPNGEKIKLASGQYKSFKVRTTNWDQKETLEGWRSSWTDHANRSLELTGSKERIDHRSLKDQGIDRIPTVHEGPTVRQMESRGIKTDRGNLNRMAKEHQAIVVQLDTYRQARKELQERNSSMTPEEGAKIARVERMLGGRATISTIQEGLKDTNQRLEGLKQRSKTLSESLDPFKRAEGLYKEIERAKSILEDSNMLKRLLNKRDRHLHDVHQQRVNRAEGELQNLGFKDRTQFGERKAKVETYIHQELSFNEQAIQQVVADYKELITAEILLKSVEIKAIATEYPNWSAAKQLNHEGAVAIKGINETLNRVVPLSEIKTMYQQLGEKMQGYQHQINDMNKTESRLKDAYQWLEKYEEQHKEAGKLFQSPKTRGDWKEKMEKSLGMMKQFGIHDRVDFNKQLQQHQGHIEQRPIIEKKMKGMLPGMNLLKSAMDGIEQANQQFNYEKRQEQQKQLKQQQRRGQVRDLDEDRGYER